MLLKWITLQKFAESSGYTEVAARAKIYRGEWVQGIHWKYAPDNRILMNIEEYCKWAEAKPTRISMRGKRQLSLASDGVTGASDPH